MRILVTGANGFVGPHLSQAINATYGSGVEMILTSNHVTGSNHSKLDVSDRASVEYTIRRNRPTHVIHLAAVATPSKAQLDPQNAWRVNLHGTLNIAESILAHAPDCILVNVSSGLVYGASAKSGRPMNEETVLAPLDVYGASKAAAELALGALIPRGLSCVRMRPFNHIGPGQSEDFVTSAIAAQVARIEAGLIPPVIRVGNLNVERDFLDVRDVALSYALVCGPTPIESGAILNVASGIPQRLEDVANWFLQNARVPISITPDPARMRPVDLPRIIGSADRIRALLNWAPQHSFFSSLEALLESWRRRMRSS